MRVWHPIPPLCLDRQRLLEYHREVHAIYSILYNNKEGYRNHPEVKRWEGHLLALALVHHDISIEMKRRGYNHKSPLVGIGLATLVRLKATRTNIMFPEPWEPIEVMRKKLAEKQS